MPISIPRAIAAWHRRSSRPGFAVRPAARLAFADKPAYLLADRLETSDGA